MIEELNFILQWIGGIISNLGSGVIFAVIAVSLLGILLGMRK